MAEKGRTRYTPEELEEFKAIIYKKLEVARDEHATLQQAVKQSNANGTDDTNNSYITQDDGAETFQKENMNQLAVRLKKFINNLNYALIRIENGTYGICKTSGNLISKERLRIVPHATETIEAKKKH